MLSMFLALALSEPFVVRNDFGGEIGARAEQIEALGDRPVEIRGLWCLSSCTMFLGAENVCVAPHVRFGFHAPVGFWGKEREQYFKYYSELIADHYPEPLRTWYLETGRYRTWPMIYFSGTELIEMGVSQC